VRTLVVAEVPPVRKLIDRRRGKKVLEDIDVSRRPHGPGGGCPPVQVNTGKFTKDTCNEKKRRRVRVATSGRIAICLPEEKRNDRAFAPPCSPLAGLSMLRTVRKDRHFRLICRHAIAAVPRSVKLARNSLDRGRSGKLWEERLRDMESMEFQGCEAQCTLVFKVDGRL